MEVHRHKGPGLIESIYERCLLRELDLRSIPAATQKLVRVEYQGSSSMRHVVSVEDANSFVAWGNPESFRG